MNVSFKRFIQRLIDVDCPYTEKLKLSWAYNLVLTHISSTDLIFSLAKHRNKDIKAQAEVRNLGNFPMGQYPIDAFNVPLLPQFCGGNREFVFSSVIIMK